MRRNTFLAASTCACAMLMLGPGAALAGSLDQQQVNADAGPLEISSNISRAQTFTAGLSGNLDEIDLHVGKLGSPSANLRVEIRAVLGGIPAATVLASTELPPSAVPFDFFVPIPLTPAVPLTPGTEYAIVAYSATSPAPANVYQWYRGSGADPYPAGREFQSFASPPAAWMGNNADLAFKTYVAPFRPTGRRAAALKKCKKKHSRKKRKKCRKKATKLPV